MVRHILDHGLADRVFVVPNARSPWRDEPLAAAGNRLAMCRLAFEGLDRVEVDGREAAAGRPGWTVDTLEALVAEQPGERWRVVIGADHLATFSAWRHPGRILELAELLVLGRAGAPIDAIAVASTGLPTGRVITAPPFDHPVSSSAVRAILCAGGDGAALLPPAVAAYIAARGLYRGA